MSATTATTTLYKQLGGMVSIDAAVDRFYERVLAEPELAPFFGGVDVRRLGAHHKAFLAMALGGPRRYAGRGLAEAHRHLAIDDHHVDLVAGHLAAVLADLGVTPAMVDEVVSAVDGLRGRRARSALIPQHRPAPRWIGHDAPMTGVIDDDGDGRPGRPNLIDGGWRPAYDW
jgi:hemoglobin